ncbi:MAG: hypothetical protein CMI18_09295 [Opitutaceae bacterium]|nr:hypothetical protein [Opitutaceae bacterium]
MDLNELLAICYVMEEEGLSDEAYHMADVLMEIPSFRFTKSFNLLVSVALTLSAISDRLDSSNIPWQLNESDKGDLYLAWLMKTENRGVQLAEYSLGQEQNMGR